MEAPSNAAPNAEGEDRPRTGAVLAVVVTYHPGPELAANLAALRVQVAGVVVIDNGSPDFAAIEQASLATGCRAIGNRTNLGIAAALNQGVALAREEGFEWLATFDQDSFAPDGAIAGLLDLHHAHPARDRIAIMAMSHRDRGAGRDYHYPVDILEETPQWRSVRATIASGSLVRRQAFDSVGGFDERLFIDGVDHDFCLRCRRAGWLVIEGKRWVLEHSIGAVTLHRFLTRTIACTNHSPTRRYYMTRNTLEVCRRYLVSDLVWSIYSALHFWGATLAVFVFEYERPAKFAATVQGVFDFARRRFGPR